MIWIDVTPRAARRVRSLLAGQPDGHRYGLRVTPDPGTGPGGASGFLLSLSPNRSDDELVLPRNGFDLLVARDEAEHLDGLRIDFLASADESGFVVDRLPQPRRPEPLPAVPGTLPPAGDADPDLIARVEQALETVRPVLTADGGDVELVTVAGGTAYVRLDGACQGCSSASLTLHSVIEQAVVGSVPEISRITLAA